MNESRRNWQRGSIEVLSRESPRACFMLITTISGMVVVSMQGEYHKLWLPPSLLWLAPIGAMWSLLVQAVQERLLRVAGRASFVAIAVTPIALLSLLSEPMWPAVASNIVRGGFVFLGLEILVMVILCDGQRLL